MYLIFLGLKWQGLPPNKIAHGSGTVAHPIREVGSFSSPMTADLYTKDRGHLARLGACGDKSAPRGRVALPFKT
jgi:hypothetical protein